MGKYILKAPQLILMYSQGQELLLWNVGINITLTLMTPRSTVFRSNSKIPRRVRISGQFIFRGYH